MLDSLVILVLICLLFLMFKSKTIKESLNDMGSALPGWSEETEDNYNNNCLTSKPYGFPSHQGAINYWKEMPKSWERKYSEKSIRGDIDTVKSNISKNSLLCGSQPAPAGLKSINGKYYHDPEQFCKDYPNQYPCPNNWVEDKGNFKVPKAKMDLPGLLSGNYGHVLDKEINDNYHIRIVEPGREDHGLCGNDH